MHNVRPNYLSFFFFLSAAGKGQISFTVVVVLVDLGAPVGFVVPAVEDDAEVSLELRLAVFSVVLIDDNFSAKSCCAFFVVAVFTTSGLIFGIVPVFGRGGTNPAFCCCTSRA